MFVTAPSIFGERAVPVVPVEHYAIPESHKQTRPAVCQQKKLDVIRWRQCN
jgi:hypothetical protein